jgi:uncharacterized protein
MRGNASAFASGFTVQGSGFRVLVLVLVAIACGARLVTAEAPSPQSPSPNAIPELTQPVNDFAHVIDVANARRMDALSRALQAKTGDVVAVATVPTVDPFADIREYAVKMFENHGKGIGQKGKDNGLLILLAIKERQVRIEVGYDLEQFITDGFSGETSRMMVPQFREGRFGDGLRFGMERIVTRIAQSRGVALDDAGVPVATPRRDATPTSFSVIFWIFIAILIISRIGGGRGRRRRFWAGGPWSGWSSGVGPFGGGGGWGGGGFGGGGGGFGGGFGGFGGGRSGGGGGGAGW